MLKAVTAPASIDGVALPASAGEGISRRRQLSGAAVAITGLPLAIVPFVGSREQTPLSTPVLLALAVVVAAAICGGIWPALPAALAGSLLLNYLHTEPYGTLDVHRLEQALALIVYTAVAVAVSIVVHLAARTQGRATRAAAEARELSRLAATQLSHTDPVDAVLRRACALFGLSGAAVLRRSGEDWHVVASAALESDADQAGHLVAADQEWALSVIGAPICPEDQPLLEACAHAAITAARARELSEQAAEASRLADVDQLRTALLAGVGHDLRTPLAGIKAAVTSLRSDEVQWSEHDRQELLQVIEQSADRLDGLVANLLGASRLNAGALSVDLSPLGLDEAVGRALAALPDSSRIVVDLPDDLPLVRADAGLLERVVANLVDNALKHSGKGTNVLINASARRDGVVLSVVDTGPGVSAQATDALFAPFQRVGDRQPGGLGLGLSVARGFTEAMGGRLEPTSTPGGGLTMQVRLPAAAA